MHCEFSMWNIKDVNLISNGLCLLFPISGTLRPNANIMVLIHFKQLKSRNTLQHYRTLNASF